MSTVTSSLTPNSVVTRIEMIMGHTSFREKVMIVVEGADDKKVYGRFFDKDHVIVYPFGGCDNFELLLTSLNPQFGHQLAVIKDADFEHIMGYDYTFPNLFRTDVHDAEAMMMTDAFYEVLSAEFLDGDDYLLSEMMKVHEELLPLSWLKLTCRVKNRKIDFASFSVHKYYQGNNTVDIAKCAEVLSVKPENIAEGVPTQAEVNDVMTTYGGVSSMQLNNGHDLCYGFAYKYKALKGSRKEISIDSLMKVLRTSFTMTQFSQTQLYSNIKDWAAQEKLNIFRSV